MPVESDPFLNPENTYSIAVTGAMNPALHHPAWYVYIGAISEQEASLTEHDVTAETADANIEIDLTPNQTYCSVQLSQFTVGRIRVVCMPQSWNISALDDSNVNRIKEITQKVFAALMHTPISGYTLSFMHHRQTSLPDVGGHLAREISTLQLGILHDPKISNESAQIRYVANSESRDLIVDLQPSVKAKNMVFVAVHAVHRIPSAPQGRITMFDLSPLLEEALVADSSTADSWVKSVLTAMANSLSS